MIDVKGIIIKPINSTTANNFIKKNHYSKTFVRGGCGVHFGAFVNNFLYGVLSFGSPLDKRKMLPLVRGTLWNEMLELNRLAFDDLLPKNSESRCLSVCFKLIKRHYPQIKWILSFADGTQCGDGTIYRASGFVLTAIKLNTQLIKFDNKIVHKHSLNQINFKGEGKEKSFKASKLLQLTKGSYSTKKYFEALGKEYETLKGYQLRYIYFLHKEEIKNLTVPIIPFSEIEKRGAKMYLGKSLCGGSSKREQLISNEKVGGVLPTPPLHLIKECNGI